MHRPTETDREELVMNGIRFSGVEQKHRTQSENRRAPKASSCQAFSAERIELNRL